MTDPLATLRRRRLAAAALLPVFAAAGLLLLHDVFFLGKTNVTPPRYAVPGAAEPMVTGLVDPLAGHAIEGAGVWITGRAFAKGDLPVWNHGEACGAPYLANGELAVLGLTALPLHLAPGVTSWEIFAAARMVLAAWLAALWVLSAGRSVPAALVAGAGFGFGGSFLQYANLVHLSAVMLTPLLFLLVDGLAARRTFPRFLALTVVYALAWNSGNPQPTVVASLAIGLRLLAGLAGGVRAALGLAASVIGAAVTGAALTAFTLLPLGVQLGMARTRWYLVDGSDLEAGTLLSWMLPTPSRLEYTEQALLQFPHWTLGVTVCTLGVLGLVTAARRSSAAAGWAAWPLVHQLILFHAGVFIVFTERLPVLTSVHWAKYAATTQLCLVFGAAAFVDRLATGSRLRILVGVAGLGLVTAPFIATDWLLDAQRLWLWIGGGVAVALSFIPPRFARSWLVIVPLLVAAEIALARPDYIDDHPPAHERDIPIVDALVDRAGESAATTGQPWRMTSFGRTLMPLTSTYLGLQDVRSMSPVPLRSYLRWIRPYANNGPGTDYQVLPVSRQLLFSPCLDLAGVRWLAVPPGYAAPVDGGDVVESDPGIVRGEFLSALVAGSQRARHVDYYNYGESWFIHGGGSLRFSMRPVSASTTFEITVKGDAFRARVAVGDDERGVGEAGILRWEVPWAPEPIDVRLEVLEGGARFAVTGFRVRRHFPKSAADYRLERVDTDAGLALVENRAALPPVRMVRRIRRCDTVEEMWRRWEHFVATGEGFDWREELLLVPAGDDMPPASDLPTDPAEVRRVVVDDEVMTIDADVRAPGWLHVATVTDGFWKATVDGAPVAVSRANGPFMAVPITAAGRHRIEFHYRPWPLTAGFVLAGATALLLAIAGFRAWRRGGRS